jgi:hypothetical protein
MVKQYGSSNDKSDPGDHHKGPTGQCYLDETESGYGQVQVVLQVHRLGVGQMGGIGRIIAAFAE